MSKFNQQGAFPHTEAQLCLLQAHQDLSHPQWVGSSLCAFLFIVGKKQSLQIKFFTSFFLSCQIFVWEKQLSGTCSMCPAFSTTSAPPLTRSSTTSWASSTGASYVQNIMEALMLPAGLLDNYDSSWYFLGNILCLPSWFDLHHKYWWWMSKSDNIRYILWLHE